MEAPGFGRATNTLAPKETEVELPFGAYRLLPDAQRRVFIATGTRLAPFLPMFAAMAAAGQLDTAELYFGCSTAKDDITHIFSPLPRTTACVSRDPSAEGVLRGRVTEPLAKLNFDPLTTHFYLCGSAAMVAECRSILARAGAMQVLTEPF